MKFSAGAGAWSLSIDDRLTEALLSSSPEIARIEQVTGRSVADPRSRLPWQLALLGAGHR